MPGQPRPYARHASPKGAIFSEGDHLVDVTPFALFLFVLPFDAETPQPPPAALNQVYVRQCATIGAQRGRRVSGSPPSSGEGPGERAGHLCVSGER